MGTFNTRFAYVSISRASHEAQVYTNDVASLADRLTRNVTKTTALGATESKHLPLGTTSVPAPKQERQLIEGVGLAL